jgi:hypothetical protein
MPESLLQVKKEIKNETFLVFITFWISSKFKEGLCVKTTVNKSIIGIYLKKLHL